MDSILGHLGVKNVRILGTWELRGHVWEPCWTPWPARGTQVAKKAQNGPPLGSILGVVFGALSDFWQFFRQLDFQSVFGRLLGSILEGFGQFLNTFLGFLGSLFRSVRRSEKCGLDILFVMNQAHGPLPTQAEKVTKYVNFWRCFLDGIVNGILEHLRVYFGSIFGPFWDQNCQKRRS